MIAAINFGAGQECIKNGTFEKDGSALNWKLVTQGGAKGEIAKDANFAVNETNSHSLRLSVEKPGAQCGIAYSGNGGFMVKSDAWHDLTFRARTEKRENGRGFGLTVSLENDTGTEVCARTTIPEVGGEWAEYTVALRTRSSNPKAQLIITLSEPGTIWFDDLSLKLRNTETAKRPEH